MGEIVEFPGTVIDLDTYRKRRTDEGTWPPDEATVKEYWQGRRNKGKKPEYVKHDGPQNSA